MNSSPPPPSFTLPPLRSNGQYPITPPDSPDEDVGGSAARDYLSDRDVKGKGKAKAQASEQLSQADHGTVEIEPEVRVSMYVRLFEEMITTVLASETYLFTPREVWVLQHILSLPYEPKYLLTRLLLRRKGRIFPFSSLLAGYESEISSAGVLSALRTLAEPLAVPEDITASEPPEDPPDLGTRPYTPVSGPSTGAGKHLGGARTLTSGPKSTRAAPPAAGTPSRAALSKRRRKPWSGLTSGLSAAEEKADPELAEALRESLWASQVGRVEVDEDGDVISGSRGVPTPPPSRPGGSRSVSGSSAGSGSAIGMGVDVDADADAGADTKPSLPSVEAFSLAPRAQARVTTFAMDETQLGLDEIMSCISADELRRVAKQRKVPANMLMRRDDICAALKGIAKRQTVLGFAPVASSPSVSASASAKGRSSTLSSRANGKATQATLPFTPRKQGSGSITSESLLIAQLLPLVGGHALQLALPLHTLIARVNLIFSRTPPISGSSASLMLPSILVSSHRRRYPAYGTPTRSVIWADRDELLGWERAVQWEAAVGDALGDSWQEQRKAPVGLGAGLSRVEGARVVRGIWEGVWPVWKGLVQGDKGNAVDVQNERGGLVGDRFRAEHVLTRIVYKSAQALGILHEYDDECMVLRALLAQRRWRRSKRGAWYERLALVLMNHYNSSPAQKEEKRREATQVCIDGLLDEDTHLIYRPALSRRLTRLENQLDLPADERHISFASLHTCETRELVAPRVPDNMGAPKLRTRVSGEQREQGAGSDDETRGWAAGGLQQTGKSVWVGREGEVTVEGWVLEWWEAKGYKGFHSEGSILTTLFALLLWPILFHPLPGAFETAYQTAPLDLGEDTFAPARATQLEARLEAMRSTPAALVMLRETDARERPRATWAVGVNWDYGAGELEEVLECLGGGAVAGICRMLAEEYRHRVSGVPDLIVWNYETREARFVEVKGPGDSLSETQKVWIDVLLSAGVQVEVCKVKAKEASKAVLERMGKRKVKAERAERAERGTRAGWGGSKLEDEEEEEMRGLRAKVEGGLVDGREEDDEGEGEGEVDVQEVEREGYWERGGKRVKV